MSAPNTITVQPAGVDRWIARIDEDALAFLRRRADGEMLVRDLEFGRFIGHPNPHNVRKVIRLHRKDLGEVFSSEEKTSSAAGGRPGTGYWLTRGQALKVAAWSRTPRAMALLDLIVRVFLAVIDGCRPVTDASPPTYVPATPTLEFAGANFHVLDPLRFEAARLAKRTGEKASTIRRRMEKKLRNQLEYNGPGKSWANYANGDTSVAVLKQKRDAVFTTEWTIARALPARGSAGWIQMELFAAMLALAEHKPN